jgi:CheY-like chemotaxis protein
MANIGAGILVVDDEQSIRSSMSLLLTELGFHVRSACDGCSALLAIDQQMPDIVLSDLNMPGMSGFEFLAIVRRSYPSILVIAMSGSFHGDEVPLGVAADGFYQKGSSIGCLLRMLAGLHHAERVRSSDPARGAYSQNQATA